MKLALESLFVGLVLAVFVASPAVSQQRYGWTISRTATSPCVTSGNLPPGVATLHLWYAYNSPDGLSAADISVVQSPPGAVNILAFTTANGFLNAGSATNLLLAIGGCPNGPVHAGSWLVEAVSPQWELCLGGVNLSVNCDLNPVPFSNDHMGYVNNSSEFPCCVGFGTGQCLGCVTVSVEDDTWGGIKSQYR